MRRLRSLLTALGLVVTALASCGGDAELEAARFHLSKGRLEKADELLAGESGPRAEALRAALAEARRRRGALEERIATIEAELTPREAVEALRALRGEASDPVSAELVEVALSRAADRRAEGRARSGGAEPAAEPGYSESELAALQREAERSSHPSTTGGGAEPEPRVDSRRAASGDVLASVASKVRAAMAERDWRRAIGELDLARAEAGERRADFDALREEVTQLALVELDELLERAGEVERDEGLEAADLLLGREVARFPERGALGRIHDALSELDGRIEVLALAERAQPAPPRVVPEPARPPQGAEPPGAAADDPLVARARQLEERGELEEAVEAWIEAGFAARPGTTRDARIARSRWLERRLTLRSEIAAALSRDAEGFAADLGVEAADAEGLTVRGARQPWARVPVVLLRRLAGRADASQRARLGLLAEELLAASSGAPEELDAALAAVARAVASDELAEVEAWALVARARGEELPEGGYVFADGRWVGAREHQRALFLARVDDLREKLANAGPSVRDEALAQLVAFGPDATAAIASALGARWERASRAVAKAATLPQLARVADQRRELDARRADALELIFDEEEYFYPYNVPDVPPEKAVLYPAVQRRVDELVAAVRAVWDAPREVRLPRSVRESVEELRWVDELRARHAPGIELRADLPDWVLAVDPELDRIDLTAFAWDEDERRARAYDRAVVALNERRWAAARDLPEARVPDSAERRQVEITNEYRRMMGRRLLAWNPLLQEAARGHSDYMSSTGNFGHYEEEHPDRRTPFDRMRLVGYDLGASENCHMGSGDPLGAHNGWRRSSGHHRNLLMPGHREMASGLSGYYWTQNFGTGTDFLDDLDGWQD